MQKIDIKGHSGCNIDVIDVNDKLYVRKSTKDFMYFNRLYLQGQKQLNDSKNQNIVDVPKVHQLTKANDETYIIMDYIYAKNFIDYFEYASKLDIDNFINTFIRYIDNELSNCEVKQIDKQIFIDKFKSVESNCHKNKLLDLLDVDIILDKAEKIFSELPDKLELPVNICHGDLTFSNILFTSNKFYFIDYLDSFIETPLQDIVKLRQDTRYFWSTLMYSKSYDKIRLHLIFDYIDYNINEYYKDNWHYSKWYNVLQIMNILRILPYVKEERVRDFVIKILDDLL